MRLKRVLSALLCSTLLTLGVVAVNEGTKEKEVRAIEESITYTFTSKAWGDSQSGWTSNKEGNQLTSNRGIQVTTGSTGANATSKSSFKNINSIIVTYSTNASSGAGKIEITVGTNEKKSISVTKTGGTEDRNLEFSNFEGQEGTINIAVNCTTNSIYVKSITINYVNDAAPEYTSYDVLFDSNGGSEVQDGKSSASTGLVEMPENPTYVGHKLLGWFIDDNDNRKKDDNENYWNFSDEVTDDLILTADWQELPSNSITFSDYYNDSDNLSILKTTEFSIEFEKNNGSQPVYYPSDFTGRVYIDNSFVIRSLVANKAISSIMFEFGKEKGSFSCDIGSYSSSTWTGTAENVEFTVSAKAFIKSISITTISSKTEYSVLFDYNGDDANTDDLEVLSDKYTGLAEKPEDPVKTGYIFDGWFVDDNSNGEKDGNENYWNFSDEITEDLILTAGYTKQLSFQTDVNEIKSHFKLGVSYDKHFTASDTAAVSGYYLVKNTMDLSVGDVVTIVNSTYNKVIGAQATNNRPGEDVSINDNMFSSIGNGQSLTIEEGKEIGTYAFNTGTGYLYAASSGSNHLKTENTLTNNSSWKIAIDNNGNASIVAQGNYTRNIIRYNSSNTLFSCYASGQDDIQLYKYVEAGDVVSYNYTYDNSSFKLLVGVDKTITNISDIDTYGIKVNDVYFEYTNEKFHEDGNLLYTVIDLGDILAEQEHADVTFTVCGYVEANGVKYDSASTKEYSVKTLLKHYIDNAKSLNIESHLPILTELYQDALGGTL